MKLAAFVVLWLASLPFAGSASLVDGGRKGRGDALLLVDAPLVSGRIPRYLDGDDWQVFSTDGLSFGGSVPGDLISDMFNQRLIPDPLYADNFKGADWDKGNFTYTKYFKSNDDDSLTIKSEERTLLVFDGIKMAARVSLNGQELFIASNQFVRYIQDVSSLLLVNNILQVEFFPSSFEANQESRWMGCSGAWDWAPYCTTFSSTGSHTFSKGLWKSVYLLKVPLLQAAASSSTVVIEHIVPHVYYKDVYPSSPLASDNAGPFEVLVAVHLLVKGPIDKSNLKVLLRGEWEADKGKEIKGDLESEEDDFIIEEEAKSASLSSTSLRKIVVRKRLAVGAGQVRLWWPSGMGEQTQYNLSVSLLLSSSSFSLHNNDTNNKKEEEDGSFVLVEATRKIAFRVAYLVTTGDEEEKRGAEQDGTGTFTMRLNINGAAFFARGANVIPTDELEGRVTSLAISKMLESAKQGHFNMLRVWGGGVFFHDFFYSTCDELGLLIWEDLMYGYPWFGGNSGVPLDSPMQTEEIKHQMRRLSHHASIVVWNTCNECQGDEGLYASFVSPLMASEDPSRIIWPASPSLGWQSGVDGQTGLANGKPVVPKPSTSTSFSSPSPPRCNPSLQQETHGPYQHGEGFKTVNSDAKLEPFDPNVPPVLDSPTYVLGPQCPGNFASEFGASVMSSFESMSHTLPREAWGLHVDLMHERNYATDNTIQAHFPLTWPRDFLNVGEDNFKRYLYMSMLSQAFVMKSDISTRRARNSFALLVWQLNEIWPTGGWGSLEYGSADAAIESSRGQIIGGRWKPLHFFYKQHLFTDVFVTCGADARCLVRNDNSLLPFTGILNLRLLHMPTGIITPLLLGFEIDLPRGAAAAVWLCANGKGDSFSESACTSWDEMLLELSPICTPVSACMLLTSLTSTVTTTSLPVTLYSSFELLAPLKASIPLLPSHTSVDLTVQVQIGGQGETFSVRVLVTTQATALFVTLTTLAQGQFEENAFTMAGATSKVVVFIPSQDTFDEALFRDSLRSEHVMTYF